MSKILWVVFLIAGLCVTGCSMNSDEKVGALEKRVDAITGRMDAVEGRIDAVEQKQVQIEETARQKIEPPAKVTDIVMSEMDIQTALKNAGFYDGPIDGKIGPNTIKAITDFQAANGLEADGIIGAKTKSMLGKHLTPQPSGD